MARPHPFNLIFDLEIGQHIVVQPNHGETVEVALRRIKLRLSKYRKDERSYQATIETGAIRVERVPFGLNSKYWPWIALRQNERLLVSEEDTDQEKRRVQNSIQFLHNQARYEKLWVWHAIRGKLYVECVSDANLERKPKASAPLTPEETLRRDIRIRQGGIEQMRRSGGSEGVRAEMDLMCEREQESIEELRRELEQLELKPPHLHVLS